MNQVAFSPETLTAIAAAAGNFCKADTDRAFALHEFMRLVGDEPSYDNWMLARGAAIQGYLTTKPQANADAQDKFWSRYVTQLRTYVNEQGFEMKFPEKPKAETPAAEAMRKARANDYVGKPKAELADTVAKLQAELKATPTAAVAAELVKAQTAIDKLVKAEQREADKSANKDKNKRIDNIAAFLKRSNMDVVVLFEALVDANEATNPDDVRMKAWEMLRDVSIKNVGVSLDKLESAAPAKRQRKAK